MSDCPIITAALRIDESAGKVDYDLRFREIATFLLNRIELVVCGTKRFRLAEIEFYWTSKDFHPDPFTHCDERQLEFATWYFHRSGKTYKGGTYKGLDIAIGNSAAGVFGGVLIRALQDENGDVIEGSCLCANAILDAAGVTTVAELADGLLGGNRSAVSTDVKHPLRLALSSGAPRTASVHSSMRVGLTLKQKEAQAERFKYIGSRYRFLTRADAIRKGAPQLAAALAADGKDVAEVTSALAMKPASVKAYVDAFVGAKTRKLSSFVGATIKPAEYAELFAAWLAWTQAQK